MNLSINVESLQELESREEVGLEGCPILGSCCGPGLPPFYTTVFTCFGCTFTI
jgi:hypothetical protein